MGLKKFYVEKERPGYAFDKRKKQWYSWGFDFWAGGKRYQERGFKTAEQAETVIAEIRARAKYSRHGIEDRTQSPLLVELLQKKLDTMAGPDRVRAKRVFNDFKSLLPKTIKVSELESSDFEKYNQKRQRDKVSAATIRRELVPLVAALNSASLSFPSLKKYRPPAIPRPAISKLRKTRTITFGERRAILEALYAPARQCEAPAKANARHETAVFLQFALLTASRPGEVAKLKHTDVDLYSGIVQIAGTKTKYSTGVVRYLVITPTMERILRDRISKAPGEYLFTPNGRVQARMYVAMKEACEAHGIKYGKHDRDGVIFNTARHTATTTLVQNQVDTKTAGAFTGHADQTMTLHYSHPNKQTLDQAANVLEQEMGGDFEAVLRLDGEEVPSDFENKRSRYA